LQELFRFTNLSSARAHQQELRSLQRPSVLSGILSLPCASFNSDMFLASAPPSNRAVLPGRSSAGPTAAVPAAAARCIRRRRAGPAVLAFSNGPATQVAELSAVAKDKQPASQKQQAVDSRSNVPPPQTIRNMVFVTSEVGVWVTAALIGSRSLRLAARIIVQSIIV
jgi:hypothetical protein